MTSQTMYIPTYGTAQAGFPFANAQQEINAILQQAEHFFVDEQEVSGTAYDEALAEVNVDALVDEDETLAVGTIVHERIGAASKQQEEGVIHFERRTGISSSTGSVWHMLGMAFYYLFKKLEF